MHLYDYLRIDLLYTNTCCIVMVGNNFDLMVALLDLATRLNEREHIEMLLEILTAAVKVTLSTY